MGNYKQERKYLWTIIICMLLLFSSLFIYLLWKQVSKDENNLEIDEIRTTPNSFSFWTNHTGEWENYVVVKEEVKKFYKNGERIYLDCYIENKVYNQEDVIEKYLCGILERGTKKQFLEWDGYCIETDLGDSIKYFCPYNNGLFNFTYIFPKLIEEIALWNRTLNTQPKGS